MHAPAGAWANSGQVAALELEEDAVDSWDIEVRDYERAGGLVRLNVTGVVQSWLDEETDNYGLLLITDAVSANTLGGQFSGARLVLR